MSDVVETVVARIVVTGRVQGVGFRFFAGDTAEELGIVGWAKNLNDGRVEVEAHGVKERVDVMIERLRQGPSSASVSNVDVTWLSGQVRTDDLRDFQILQ